MNPDTQPVPSTLIISVYKDTENLACILDALSMQTVPPSEIIVSEDGQDPVMKNFVDNAKQNWPSLIHLTQEDNGFRKNRALNRAITQSKNDLLIFIDGDCVPHREFIRAHTEYCRPGKIATGRRAEIGPVFSSLIKKSPLFRRLINSKWFYIPLILLMSLDKGKNV
ncbi:MAG: glycosyltransferase, partial [Gammaproteobacteria bacterium]